MTFWSVVAFLVLKLGIALVNLATFPRLKANAERDVSDVSLLVPARDEADNLITTLPALAAQGAGEVLLLDDGSTDETARLAAEVPGVRVLHGQPLPEGWLGKPWACQQLADAASRPWLVFTDADVHWGPGALGALRDGLDDAGARVGSVFPTQVTATLGERLTVPLIDDVLLSFLPQPVVDADLSRAAVAVNGGVVALERSAYRRVGGHAAVADRVIEDVALGHAARRAGERVAVMVGAGVISVRMYRGYRNVVLGFGKNLRAAHGGSRSLLLADLAWHAVAYTAPLVRARTQRRWLFPLALGVAQRSVVLRTSQRPVWEALLAPILPLAALPVALQAMRSRQQWKGREVGM